MTGARRDARGPTPGAQPSPGAPAEGSEPGGPDPAARLRAEVEAWIASDPDPATRGELESLLHRGDVAALHERFAEPLSFGTAGLRGAIGAGPGRMNRLVVRRTTAGLAVWLRAQHDAGDGSLVVGRDARHGSEPFASDTADVASAAGVPVRTLSRPLPTPVTAFAVRHLGAGAGVMVTASHNPATDNGYKVYLADGAQVLPPYDEEIAAAARAASRKGSGTCPPARAHGPVGGRAAVERIDEQELLRAYQAAVLACLDADAPRTVDVVYTPLHGVGGAVAPALFEAAGFAPPWVVPAQAVPDPDFPTVAFPNPEEPGALGLALALAAEHGADVVLANDPDADRLAVAVPLADGRWRVLTGDEVGALIGEHLLERSHGDDRLVATTIVSSTLLASLAHEAGVAYRETLTGFKWIARAAASSPGMRLLFGYEEALGYAVTDAVADKDGMSAAVVVAGLVARARADGSTLLDRLDAIEARLGVHATAQWSLRLDGAGASARMAAVVARWRDDPPASLAGHAVSEVVDLALGTGSLPPTDAVVLKMGTTGRVVLRPSGTEPKLKAYLEVTSSPPGFAGLASDRVDASRLLVELRADVASRCRGI
ncbi:MAG: phospho-sugar mutase [Acidimicrobiales bacterium]